VDPIYVLIILWFPSTNQSGKVIHSHEFNNRTACEAARAEVLKQEAGSNTLLRAVCVNKTTR